LQVSLLDAQQERQLMAQEAAADREALQREVFDSTTQ
jgi:hypothetical protein